MNNAGFLVVNKADSCSKMIFQIFPKITYGFLLVII